MLAPAALAAPWRSPWSPSLALRRVLARRPAPRVVEAWGCGRQLQTARMQYTATSFAEPVQRVFDDVLRPVQDLDVSHVAESRYVIEAVTFHNAVDDAIERALYRPGHPGRPSLGPGGAPPCSRAVSTATWPTGLARLVAPPGRRWR